MPRGVYIRTKIVSLETRKKLSENNPRYWLGKTIPLKTRLKISKGNKGKIVSKETRIKIGLSEADEKHHKWKGDNVGYNSLHSWIRRKLGTPKICEHCKKENLIGHKIHWANKSREYKRDITDWIRLCPKCHGKFDKEKRRNKKLLKT